MNRRLPLYLALIVTVMRVTAQQPLKPLDPPELITDRADHLRAMQRAAIPPLTNYLRTLESLQQFYTRQNKADAATSVAAEITTVKEQLEEAEAGSNISLTAPVQLQIDKVEYGDLARNHVLDETKYVQNAFAAGKATVSIYGATMAGASDPAPGISKSVRVTYTINGKRKEKIYKEGPDAILDFKKDLR
jgi:hypothetical protein